MEDVKKERSRKGATVSRRVKELENACKRDVDPIEIKEKISNVKYTFEELGELQDKLIELLPDEPAKKVSETWYDGYDDKVNRVIRLARNTIKISEDAKKNDVPVKLEKLKIPEFNSDTKRYLKWKETFERYTKSLNDEIKYDYLLSSTKGRSKELVGNKATYDEAIESLDKEYGNKHIIMGLLIEDLKSIPPVRKGDFKAFEKLTYEANAFRDRLKEMGLIDEAENGYILKELEGKLHSEDLHRWLESLGRNVDKRLVEDLVNWLEFQRDLRRISNPSLSRTNPTVPSSSDTKNV